MRFYILAGETLMTAILTIVLFSVMLTACEFPIETRLVKNTDPGTGVVCYRFYLHEGMSCLNTIGKVEGK